MLKYRLNDWITVSWFGDSVIVGLQCVHSIDFLSDAMKPSVPPVGEADCRSGEEEGERERWRGRGGGGEAWTYNVAHLSEHRNKSGAATLM